MLHKLYQLLQKSKKYQNVIPQNFIEEVNHRKKQSEKMKEEAQQFEANLTPNLEKLSLKKKLIMKSTKVQEKTLMEFLKNKFKALDKQVVLDE